MNWEESVTQTFIADLDPKIWVAADPDQIVRSEPILNQLQSKGFNILIFDDPILFRFQYESVIRIEWDAGGTQPLVVIYDPSHTDKDTLPSDILGLCHEYSFGLDDIFPLINKEVMRAAPPKHWNKLNTRAQRSGHTTLNRRQSEELALKVIYKLVPELIEDECFFLAKCIHLHNSKIELAPCLARYLHENISTVVKNTGWPIEALITSASVFWSFLQERWAYYIANQTQTSIPELVIEGSPLVTFDEVQLKALAPSLFLSHSLSPINLADINPAEISDYWWQVGIQQKVTKASTTQDMTKLMDVVISTIPEADGSYRDWVTFSNDYSALVAQLFNLNDVGLCNKFWGNIWPQIDESFKSWFFTSYSGLHNLPPRPPVMVHHVPKQMENWYKKNQQKTALIVLDGLSVAGWKAIKESITKHLDEQASYEESATLAWTPSSTPVSRQALYSGLAPRFFEKSIGTTSRDASRWQSFWESQTGMLKKHIAHTRCDGDIDDLDEIQELIDLEPKAIGITVSKPDIIMHHAVFGWKSYFSDLQTWMNEGFLVSLIDRLVSAGYGISICADHGNLESIGMGNIQEGILAETRGQRVRVYPEQTLRDKAHQQHPATTTAWDTNLLPDDYYMLFPQGRSAFETKDKLIVSHGGISLDEIMVPWININRI